MSADAQGEIPQIFHGATDYQNDPDLLELAQGTFNEEALYEKIVGFAVQWARRLSLQQATVLDLCSGTGLCAVHVAKGIKTAKVVLVDTNENMLDKATRNFAALRGANRPTVVPLHADAVTVDATDRFDIITMNSAYHHVHPDQKVQFLSHARQLLNDRGIILVGEHFIRAYSDGTDFKESVISFYEDLIPALESASAPSAAIQVIRCSGLYCWKGEYEYKTSFEEFTRHIREAGLDLVAKKAVWELSDTIGSFALCLSPQSRTSIRQRLTRMFEDKKDTCSDVREALKLLERCEDDALGLTGLSCLVQYYCGMDYDDLSDVLWVNVELEVRMGVHKAVRMRPVAILGNDVEHVMSFHTPLLDRVDSWNKKVAEEKWLPLSSVMDYWWYSHDVMCYLVLLPNAVHRIRDFKECELFRQGALALIYPQEGGAEAAYVLDHCSRGEDVIVVNTDIGKTEYSFARFADWLGQCRLRGRNVGIYAGFESLGQTQRQSINIKECAIRFWVAFTEDVAIQTVISLGHFEHAFKNDYLTVIQRTVRQEQDVVRWFLNPPGSDVYPGIVWFDARMPEPSSSHNNGLGLFGEHHDAVARRFPWWARDEDLAENGMPAKALVFSQGVSVMLQSGGYKTFPAERLSSLFDVFDTRMQLKIDGLLPGDRIALPVVPGLPFLLAVHKFFMRVLEERPGSEENCILCRPTSDTLALGIQVENPMSLIHAFRKEVESRWASKSGRPVIRTGHMVASAFVDAAYAKVDSSAYKSYALRGLLEGVQEQCAEPWYGTSYIGLWWKDQ